MKVNLPRAAEKISSTFKRLMDEGYGVVSDGNISVRDEWGILVTPSGLSKGNLSAEDIVLVDKEGKKIKGKHNPTSELPLHLEVYKQRADINCVIHAHPPAAIALSAAGLSLEDIYIPEAALYLGSVPTAKYAAPATVQGSQVIKGLIVRCDALILERHGTVTVGADIDEAYNKLVRLERCADIVLKAFSCGKPKALSKPQLKELLEIRRRHGIKGMGYIKGIEK